MSAELMLVERFPDGHYNTDTRCPRDREMVNVCCWRCGWIRDAAERQGTMATLAPEVPADHHPVAEYSSPSVMVACSCGVPTPDSATSFANHLRTLTAGPDL